MTTGQVLTAVKAMKVTTMSMTVMPLTLGEMMTQVTSFLHSSIQMRKMPMRGQMPHAQGEPQLGDPKLTSFDLFFKQQLSVV